MKVPARLTHIHPSLLEHAFAVTDGDFSRVRPEGTNGLIILNRAWNDTTPLIKPAIVQAAGAKKPPRTTATRKAAAKNPAPAPELTRQELAEIRDPQAMTPAPVVRQPISKLPKHLQPEPVRVRRTRPEPERAKLAPEPAKETTPTVRDRLTEAERQYAETLKKPLPKFDRPVPPEFDIRNAWETLDVDRVASSMLNACRAGLPEILPLDLHAEVLALEGVQADIVITSVRHPQFVEIAGSDTKAKGYPILRFYKGDVMTVVGLRDARYPVVIASYAHSQLQNDTHRVGHMGGGGGARKASGLPKTPVLVARRLRQMGAEVAVDEMSGEPATVTYRGQDLGKISTKGDKNQCESDYQRIVRKMEAIARRG